MICMQNDYYLGASRLVMQRQKKKVINSVDTKCKKTVIMNACDISAYHWQNQTEPNWTRLQTNNLKITRFEYFHNISICIHSRRDNEFKPVRIENFHTIKTLITKQLFKPNLIKKIDLKIQSNSLKLKPFTVLSLNQTGNISPFNQPKSEKYIM